jgi:hypothetical protein
MPGIQFKGQEHMPKSNSVSNSNAPTAFLTVGNEKYAYRRFGSGSQPPLLCLQHFTGTLDNWDPAVTDALARRGEVILFESAGIGRSSGKVPVSVAGMAEHALAFLDGLGIGSCDVLGFSLGGMVAQQISARPFIDLSKNGPGRNGAPRRRGHYASGKTESGEAPSGSEP